MRDNTGLWFLGIMLLFVVAVGIFLYQDSQRPTFELFKAEWSCTQEESYTSMQYSPPLKMAVPVTRIRCINYQRK